LQTDLNDLLVKIEKARIAGIPFVIYKKPENNVVKALFQKDADLYFSKNLSESGFVFAPFEPFENNLLFPKEKSDSFYAVLDDFSVEVKVSKTIDDKKGDEKKSDSNSAQQEHIQLVEKGIAAIQKGLLEKVVLSRKEAIKLDKFDIKIIFQKLLATYPATFVYCWFHPKVGLWIGATPETLIKTKNSRFKTMALASTQNYEGTLDVVWGEKEIQEQQFVTDFISANLDDLDLKIGKPFTLKAGSLLHICSEISGKLTSNEQLLELVKTLHPTPAVCGLPKEAAKEFILKNENYKREFYTGFLGEINCKSENNEALEETNLFVNLRCTQVKNEKAFVYVGGGITINSNAEKEWKETVAKSFIMKRVL
jgi:isochorismate synthase